MKRSLLRLWLFIFFTLFSALSFGAEKEKAERVISLFGIGSITTPDADLSESSASGGVGIGYFGPWFETSFFVTKGTASTVGGSVEKPAESSAYGYTILDQRSSNYNCSILSAYHFSEIPTIRSIKARVGAFVRLSASNVNWAYPVKEEMKSISVTPLGFDIGGSGQARVRLDGGGDAIFTLRPAFSLRRIGGDISSDKELRRIMLGTSQRTFVGPSLDFSVRFGGISLGVIGSNYVARSSTSSSANGLTDTRFILSISGVAPVDFPVGE